MLMGMGKQIQLIPVKQQLPDTPPETTPPRPSFENRGGVVMGCYNFINTPLLPQYKTDGLVFTGTFHLGHIHTLGQTA